jgi:predicted PurR-regulated permease PerM
VHGRVWQMEPSTSGGISLGAQALPWLDIERAETMSQTSPSIFRAQRPHGPMQAQLQYFGLIPAAIVVMGLYFGRPVLLPLAIAILLAFALAPLVAGLRHLGIGRISSVLLSAMVSIGILVAIGFYVGNQLLQLTDQLPQYQSNLVRKIETIRGTAADDGLIGRTSSMLKTLRDSVSGPKPLQTPRAAAPATSNQAVQEPIPVQIRQPDATPLDLLMTVAGPLLAPLAAAGIVLVFVIFILLHKEDLRDRFISLAGSGDLQRTTLLLDDGAEKLSHYLLTQTAINIGFGFVIAAGLWLIGIPNPILWALVGAVLRFVPYIGVPLATIPPIVLALSVDPGWQMLAWTLLLFVIVEILVGQAIEPWLYARKMGLSAVAIIISATFWTWLWGPLGLLLSTPLTMCLVVLGRHVDHLQFLEVLLGDRPPLAVEEALYLRMLGDDADEAAAEAETFLKENSICCYYDEVALKALGLAQADINRGALDGDRVARINETTQALIQNLSFLANDQDSIGDTAIDAASPGSSPRLTKSVLCIGGRGRLDEAAAWLLINLLEEQGIGARLVASTEVSASNVDKLDITDTTVVCLCYLDPGNLARARYLMRRIRHHMPAAKIIAAFWGFNKEGSEADQTMGCEIVTGLKEAVEKIAAMRADASGQPAEQQIVEARGRADALISERKTKGRPKAMASDVE